MDSTRHIGNLSEAKIILASLQAGYLVSQPFGDGHKYDLVVDDGTRLYRVQCKTGRVRGGVLKFNAYSFAGNRASRQSYKGLADFFAVLNPETDAVYFIPIEDVGMYDVNLRLTPARNNQEQRVRWAEHYLLRPILPDARVAQW